MTLRDGRRIDSGASVTGDICIVGAGVAGITLANELAAASARTVLVEGGTSSFTKSLRSLPAVIKRHVRGEQALAKGRNVGAPYYPLRFTRARALGGSSRAWSHRGVHAAPLDPIDFVERDGLPLHGWPFGRTHLDPYYVRAQRVCNLGPFEYDVDAWEQRGFGTPMALDEQRVCSTMFQFGRDSKFDRFRGDLNDAPTTDVIMHAVATELVADSDDRVGRMVVRTLSGNEFSVSADIFVLATGAIENARLLLMSTGRDSRGLGNAHDVVGRYYMEHPDVELGFFIPADGLTLDDFALYMSRSAAPDLDVHAMVRPSDAVLEREGLLNSVMRVRPTYPTARPPAVQSGRIIRRSVHHGVPTAALPTHALRVLMHADQLVRHQVNKQTTSPSVFGLDIMSEQAPNPASRVTLGTRRDKLGLPVTTVDWRLTTIDRHSIRRACELLAESIEDAGLGTVICTLDEQPARRAVFGNWHHLGSTRMHRDPTRGVVDEDCRVHGVENLFVAGGSVFPTGGYANPALTITALALRLADKLRGCH